jgi:hypothetical protein
MTGDEPGYAGDEIYVSLREHALSQGTGRAVADGKGFLCNLPNRQSFSPDAAFYTGPSGGKRFFPNRRCLPLKCESKTIMAPKPSATWRKSALLVVWDVDLDGDTEIVVKYRASDPFHPHVFGRGEEAAAQPAVAGWKMRVDALFAPTRTGI